MVSFSGLVTSVQELSLIENKNPAISWDFAGKWQNLASFSGLVTSVQELCVTGRHPFRVGS